MTENKPYKAAFFDMDGTICAPKFIMENGEEVIGFSPTKWIAFCNKMREKAYDNCPLIQPAVEFAKTLKNDGYTLYILTCTLSGGERTAKREYLLNNDLDRIFEDIVFFDTDYEKIAFMEQVASKHMLNIHDCVFVDDTLSTLLQAHTRGIQAIHISNILTGSITG
jgi:FMN phosphatase YigB (HAD superfamily)